MPYSLRVKTLAYQMDPPCWRSYSGLHPSHKRRMEARRVAALNGAQRFITAIDKIASSIPSRRPEVPMPPMKIAMMLHFATVVGPYPDPERTSQAYAKFAQELLEQEMIERPTRDERVAYPDWAYKATARGQVYVEALKRIPLPVRAGPPQWVMPK